MVAAPMPSKEQKRVLLTKVEVCQGKRGTFWRLFDAEEAKYVIFGVADFVHAGWISRNLADNPEWHATGKTFEVSIPATVRYDGNKWKVTPDKRFKTKTIRIDTLEPGMMISHMKDHYHVLAAEGNGDGTVYVVARDQLSKSISSFRLFNVAGIDLVMDAHPSEPDPYHPVIHVGDKVQYGPFDDATVIHIGDYIKLETADGMQFKANPKMIFVHDFQIHGKVVTLVEFGSYPAGAVGVVSIINDRSIEFAINKDLFTAQIDELVPLGRISTSLNRTRYLPERLTDDSVIWNGGIWDVERRDENGMLANQKRKFTVYIKNEDAYPIDPKVSNLVWKLQNKIALLEDELRHERLDPYLRKIAVSIREYIHHTEDLPCTD